MMLEHQETQAEAPLLAPPGEPDATSDVCDLDAEGPQDDACLELAEAVAAHVARTRRSRSRRRSGTVLAACISLGTHVALLAVASAIAGSPKPQRIMLLSAGNLDPSSESIPDGADVRDSEQIAREAIQPLDQIQLPQVDPSATPARLELPPISLESLPEQDQSELRPAPLAPPPVSFALSTEPTMIALTPAEAPTGWTPPVSAPAVAASAATITAPPTQTIANAANGVRTPPRIAASIGRRGARDGLDGRGLPIPEYPAESRKRREQGVVELDVEVLADGSIGRIRVAADPGFPLLVQAAIAAVKSAKFDPATVDEKPATGRLLIPFRFTLD